MEEIEGGGEVRYIAYNEKGNKKRIFDSFKEASAGDKVIFYESHPVKAVIAIGTVTEPLDDSKAKQEQGIRIKFDRSVREITWEELNDIPALENASPITNRAQGSLFELEEAEYDEILALEETTGRSEVSGDALDRFRAKLTPPTFDVSIPDGLYFEDKARLKREIDASLNSGKHLIFTGPPGTGKTKLAKSICVEATQRAQIDDYRFTTATSEWTAFDTIGGYVPRKGDGVQELEFEPRMFLKCFRQDRVVNEWLVIDEINRADIDKAFGQMFSVLSADSTELPYERQRTVELKAVTDSMTDDQLSEILADLDAFPITPSWRLIATMNTYDKTSLYEMSYAFMRRFNFIHVGIPELTSPAGIRTSLLDSANAPNYASVWVDEDESLRPVLESHHEVITVLWHSINQYKPVGPAIVHDIVRFLASYDLDVNEVSEALSSAFVALVLPQLEGLRPEQQQELIRSLSDGSVEIEGGEVLLDLEKEYLERKASDFLKVPFDDDE